ncbi:MAG TPA: serine hydrolase domain-containing protein [Gaiellaceae bacterium]|nr:serine hydrolase domain-containing protein [Gaiellaceae bacterium]
MDALGAIDGWGAEHAAAALVRPDGAVDPHGETEHEFRWASITKLLTAYALLVALEEGIVDLDDEAGPPGSTVRHLAAHASGLPFEGDGPPIAQPGQRRIYSNPGYEALAEAIGTAAGMPFGEYLRAAVSEPLGLSGALRGSPAADYFGPLADAVAFAGELLRPRLVAPETLTEATSVHFPGLGGVLPGFGRWEPNDWGLGFELRDEKQPHWTGSRNSPRTFGHFGGSGTFLWVDPELGAALACLTDREFGDWALEAWPRLSDAVVAELSPP